MATDRRTYLTPFPDSHPDQPVERGVFGKGVGWWVPEVKHRLLADYVEAASGARSKYGHRVFVDLFAGPGRVQVEGENETRPGGSVVAWRQSLRVPSAAFTQVIVGDLDPARVEASRLRLAAAGAPVVALPGKAQDTVDEALRVLPSSGLTLVYLDPYNLELLHFDIIRKLAELPRVDFVVHWSTSDLTRSVELVFSRDSPRFDHAVPGWRDRIDPNTLAKRVLREAVFEDWRQQVMALGFRFSKMSPLIRDNGNRPRYRLLLFSRHPLANDLWDDVAQGDTRDFFA